METKGCEYIDGLTRIYLIRQLSGQEISVPIKQVLGV